MSETEKFFPTEQSLGKPCQYWLPLKGCNYPKLEMQGRRSCEGIVDDVCLFLRIGRTPKSISSEQMVYLRTRRPGNNLDIPPGDVIK
jgi:hypothetical protein